MKYFQREAVLLILLLFFFHSSLLSFQSRLSYKINIFSINNGKGLEQSRLILKEVLEEQGHQVYEKEISERVSQNESKVDINIFFETLDSEWFPYAQLNWFIPNPEWYSQPIDFLKNIDLVLCRNRLVEDIFKPLVKTTYFMGFSSRDFYLEGIAKDFSSCLHLAGGSPYKGTNTIIKAWGGGGSKCPPFFYKCSLISDNTRLKIQLIGY